MKKLTLSEIAALVDGELKGEPNIEISGIKNLDEAQKGDITFAVAEKLFDKVKDSKASAFILPKNWPHKEERPAIFVDDPYLAYAILANEFYKRPFKPMGIDKRAIIGDGCEIHSEVSILQGAIIGNNVKIKNGVTIHPGAVIGDGVEIEEKSEIFPNVVIYPGCIIGKRVRIHAGSVIGADGFGYAQSPKGMVKIPQVGIVIIEDDVEIGANTTIDRAAFGETRIGKGTKIDNLVMIAHNCKIGPHCAIVSQVGISGSTKIGTGVMLAGQVGIVGHIEIGDGVKIGAKSGVPNSVKAGQVVSGIPAMPHRRFLRVVNYVKKLPEIVKEIREIKKRLDKVEKNEQ